MNVHSPTLPAALGTGAFTHPHPTTSSQLEAIFQQDTNLPILSKPAFFGNRWGLCQRTLVWKGCVSWSLHAELQKGVGYKKLLCVSTAWLLSPNLPSV